MCKTVRETAGPFLRITKLATSCGLVAMVLMGLGTSSSAGMKNYVSASSAYVALGDSYASGEGLQSNATTYISPSNSDGCHRSVNAYPAMVAANLNVGVTQFEAYGSGGFVACSGATSKDLLSGENGEPAQLSALSSATRWTTVTVGGDDLHFSIVLLGCLDLRASVTINRTTRSFTQSGVVHERKTCAAYLTSANALVATTNGTSNEELTLEHVYEQIFVRAPTTVLAVVNYPQLFTENPPAFCPVARGISLSALFKVKSAQLNVGYSKSQVSDFNRVENELNAAIASAVSAVSALGDTIHLVDVNSLTKTTAIPCNFATNADSDMNALRFSLRSPLTSVVKNCHFDVAHLLSLRSFVTCPSNEEAVFLEHVVASKSFHPKQAAHETMARAVDSSFNQIFTTTTTAQSAS